MNTFKRIISNSKLILNIGLFSRIIKNYVDMILFKEKRMNSVSIALTYDCPAKCAHCSAETLKNKNKTQLSTKEVYNIIDQANDEKCIHINFTGGEPTIRKDLNSIIKYCNRYPWLISINTAGINLTPQKIQEYKNSGLDMLMISLDGVSIDHNKSRKVNSLYTNVISTLKECHKLKIKTITCTIANSKNIQNGSLEKTIKHIRDLKSTPFINLEVPIGRLEGKKTFLSKNDYIKLKKIIKRYDVRRHLDGTYFGHACTAGKECIYVTAYGDINPCDFIHVSYGNIRKEKLKKIWKRMYSSKLLKQHSKKCLASESKLFHKNIMSKIPTYNEQPVNYKKLEK